MAFSAARWRCWRRWRRWRRFRRYLAACSVAAVRRRRAAARRSSRRRISARRRGQDLTPSLTITLADAAKGTKTRVASADRQGGRGQDPGRHRRRPADPPERAGLAERAGRAGDALITVNVAPHPLFKPDGADLRLELPITLYEAVLGGKVRVPTLDGAVELAIPAGTNSGRTFRLKGKGLKAKGGAGDLLATVRIVLPETARRRVRGADEEVARQEALRSARGLEYELAGLRAAAIAPATASGLIRCRTFRSDRRSPCVTSSSCSRSLGPLTT